MIMDVLNNINVIVGIIGGLFGIGGSLYGIASYLINKANSAQRKQTAQLQSQQKQASYQVVAKPLSKLDWMEVLWRGFEDAITARGGGGVTFAVMFAVFVGAMVGTIGSEAFPNFLALVLIV